MDAESREKFGGPREISASGDFMRTGEVGAWESSGWDGGVWGVGVIGSDGETSSLTRGRGWAILAIGAVV